VRLCVSMEPDVVKLLTCSKTLIFPREMPTVVCELEDISKCMRVRIRMFADAKYSRAVFFFYSQIQKRRSWIWRVLEDECENQDVCRCKVFTWCIFFLFSNQKKAFVNLGLTGIEIAFEGSPTQ